MAPEYTEIDLGEPDPAYLRKLVVDWLEANGLPALARLTVEQLSVHLQGDPDFCTLLERCGGSHVVRRQRLNAAEKRWLKRNAW